MTGAIQFIVYGTPRPQGSKMLERGGGFYRIGLYERVI